MSEAATVNAEPNAEPSIDHATDRARLRTTASLHLVMVMGALTLWGAADSWATITDWGLAWAVAIVNAIIAATVVTSVIHEWGHFAGARLSGSVSPALKKPVRYFFMFDFKFEHNDTRQFLWMSLGGILTPWLLVALALLLVPIDNASRAMLLAAFVTRAVQVAGFEVPVVLRAFQGGDPRAELGRELKTGFARSRYAGLAVGAIVFLAA